MNQARVVLVLLVVAVLPVSGCFSTHNTTLAAESGEGHVIYRLSEEQAFNIAAKAFAEVMPSASLFDITGSTRGYQATYRVVVSTYSQEVFVVPAIGTDAKGLEVHGYWFDVSGSGSAGITGSAKNRELYVGSVKPSKRRGRRSSSPTFETVSMRVTGARIAPEGETPVK
jgi:hypothetical protein